MDVVALLAAFRDRGFDLTVVDDGLRVAPASRLTEAARVALRVHKAALMALLTAPPPPSRSGCALGAERCVSWDAAYDEMSDAQFQAICDADLARYGLHIGCRHYPEPAEPPAAIWARLANPPLDAAPEGETGPERHEPLADSLPIHVGDWVTVTRPAYLKAKGRKKPVRIPSQVLRAEPATVAIVRPRARDGPWVVLATGRGYPIAWLHVVAPPEEQ